VVTLRSGPQVWSAMALAAAAVAAAVPTAIGSRQRPIGRPGRWRDPTARASTPAGGAAAGGDPTDAASAARMRARWRGRPLRPSSSAPPAGGASSAAMRSSMRSPL
jgi:hypothetical protein